MDNPVFEIVLRVLGDPDYSSFQVVADTNLAELEDMIVDMLYRHFNLISGPDERS